MRRAVVYGIKGGIGKSTLSVNMAYGLADRGAKVALMDLDPQGDSTDMLGCDATQSGGMWSVLAEGVSPMTVAVDVAKNLTLFPSNKALAVIDRWLTSQEDPGRVLADSMARVRGFDFIVMDTAPGYSLLNQNALVYAREAWLPCAMEYLSMRGVGHVTEVLNLLQSARGHAPEIRIVIPMFYDGRTKTSREVLDALRKDFPNKVSPPIRRSVKVSVAAGRGMSIFEHDKSKNGSAHDFHALVDYLLSLGKK